MPGLFFVYYFKRERDGTGRADHFALLTAITLSSLNHVKNRLYKYKTMACADIDTQAAPVALRFIETRHIKEIFHVLLY
jgi:hypothetical protein